MPQRITARPGVWIWTGTIYLKCWGGLRVQPEDLSWKLLRANFIIPSTVILRREPVIAAGLFDPNLRSCEDWDLWLRLLPTSRIIGNAECLVRYRVHGSSLSANIQGMQNAVHATIVKNFGPDDGQVENWSAVKRRAFGGVYRYFLLTSVQRRGDWGAGADYLYRALTRDASLAEDIDLFYELAMGTQSVGLRGSSEKLDLSHNAQMIIDLLDQVFTLPGNSTISYLKNKAYGTAYFALGLLAYNTGGRTQSRHYLVRALKYRPDLWRNERVPLSLIKSFFSETMIRSIKQSIGKS